MKAEIVARRFEAKSGYTLIDYAPVALPLYRLTVDAITMVHRDLTPIKEFVLKTMALGLQDPGDIAGFLGLESSVVGGTLNQLKAEKLVVQVENDDNRIDLTERGHDVLAKAKISAPQDESLVFTYDRLTLKPVRLFREDLIAPNQINALTTIEIRAYPAEGPDVKDLAIPEVSAVLEKEAGGRAAFGRDLLRLKRIFRRMRLYRPGVALVYKKMKSSEILVDFVVDDARQEELAHTFAERGGPKKMGFLKAIDESSTAGELRKYLGSDVQDVLPDLEELEERKQGVSVARIALQTAEAQAERNYGRPEENVVLDEVESARENLALAEKVLASYAARPIAPYENAELLELAFEKATKLLSISTKSVDSSVVNPLFLKRLEVLLKAKCEVVIYIEKLSSTSPNEAEVALEKLSRRHVNLSLEAGRRASIYHVVCDSLFAIVSNRPFLGNPAKVRTFAHVVGYVLQRSDLVEAFALKIRQATPRKAKKANEEARR